MQEIPPLGWERFGSLGGYAPRLHGAVVRLLWLALNPQAGFSRLPHGWAQNRFALPVTIACDAREAETRRALENRFAVRTAPDKTPIPYAICMEQRRWSCKSHCLSGPHRSRKVMSTNPNQPRHGNPSPSGKVG